MKKKYCFILGVCASLSLESAIVLESAASDRSFGDELKGPAYKVFVGVTEITGAVASFAIMNPQLISDVLFFCDGLSPSDCSLKYYTTSDLTDFRDCENANIHSRMNAYNFNNQNDYCPNIGQSSFYPQYIVDEPCENLIKVHFNNKNTFCLLSYESFHRSWSFYPILGLAAHGSLNVIAGLSGIITTTIDHVMNAIWRLKRLEGYFYTTPENTLLFNVIIESDYH